jgi:hypothetical protein
MADETEEDLAADPSPFALASLIQLRKIQAGRDVQQRYRFKLERKKVSCHFFVQDGGD